MFTAIADLVVQAESEEAPLHEVILKAEVDNYDLPSQTIRARFEERLAVMRKSVQQGLDQPVRSISGMSGGNANRLWNWFNDAQPVTGPLLSRAVARAMAVNEVNACMGCIVAAPTAGAAGVLPGVLFTLQEAYDLSDGQLVDALITAGGIGSIIVHRATVSGAVGGCQAETGSAAAMAAAGGVELLGGRPKQSAHAVAITLKNMLGLICDPVAGLVEVPCVKRNAAGTAQCFVAMDLAMAGIESVIPPDEVIDAMAQVGRAMDSRFRETAQGGLATTPTGKRLAEQVLLRP